MDLTATRQSEYLFTVAEWLCGACKKLFRTAHGDRPAFCSLCGAQFTRHVSPDLGEAMETLTGSLQSFQQNIEKAALGEGDRASRGLNCAARIGGKKSRECARLATRGDYCTPHWTVKYGHELKVGADFRLRCCVCGVLSRDVTMLDEICSEKRDSNKARHVQE